MKKIFIIFLAIFFAEIFHSCEDEFVSSQEIEEETIDTTKIEACVLDLHEKWNNAMDNKDYFALLEICTSDDWIQGELTKFKNTWDNGEEDFIKFGDMIIEELNIEDGYMILYVDAVFIYVGEIYTGKYRSGLSLGKDIYSDWKFYGYSIRSVD